MKQDLNGLVLRTSKRGTILVNEQPEKRGYFNYDTLQVRFGGKNTDPEFVIEAKAIHVPPYQYTVKERESLGGGYYGSMETNTYTEERAFLIVKENVCIGYMVHPYIQEDIASYLKPITSETNKNILYFLLKTGLKYEYLTFTKQPAQ